jgi:hypothetical protein
VEATNACRILRTRGEIGLLRFFALTFRLCVEPVFGLLAPTVLLVLAGFETFDLVGVL